MDLKAIRAAVGAPPRVQYNKPHVYPMAVPMFARRPAAERPRPESGSIEVYVHIPFCNYHCNFCTYVTRTGAREEQMERYVRALQREMTWIEPGTDLLELYLGGGTPTALPPALFENVLDAVWRPLRAPADSVHVCECSPESLSPDHLRIMREHRIGRVSMGVQSLEQEVLTRLRRDHSGREALAAVDLVISGGLMLNVDLIYGLPGQTEAGFASDFRTVAAHGVHSVTIYNLRINERTPVSGLLVEQEDLSLERLVRWRTLIRDLAAELGFEQTRWHTFTRAALPAGTAHPAARFSNFPAIGDQVGVGISARSRLSSTVYRNCTDMATYLERIESGASPVDEVFAFTDDDRKAHYIGQYLGNGRPLDRADYETRFGASFEDDFATVLPRLRDGELIEERAAAIELSATGKLVFDLVNWMFYPRAAREWIAARQGTRMRERRLGSPSTSART